LRRVVLEAGGVFRIGSDGGTDRDLGLFDQLMVMR
jgi:hypothetical protein